jgi:hypothetical protein
MAQSPVRGPTFLAGPHRASFPDSIISSNCFGQATKSGLLTKFMAAVAGILSTVPAMRLPTKGALHNRALKLTKSRGMTKGIVYDKDQGRCDPSPSDRRRNTGAIGDGRHRGYDAKDRS